MKIKSDGKQMLRFWLGLSELFVWLTVYQLFKSTGVIGTVFCMVLLFFKWYGLFTEKRDVYHRYKRHRKASISVMVFLTLTAVMLNIGNAGQCFYTLMLFFGYYLTNTYALNIYDWVIRWGDMANIDPTHVPHVYVQLDSPPELLEAANRKFLGSRLIPALLGASALCYGIWISPVFNWLRGQLTYVFLMIALFLADTILKIYPDMQNVDPTSLQGGATGPKFSSIEEMRKIAAANHFGTSYQVAAFLIVGLMVAAVAYYGYKVLKRSSSKSLSSDFKSSKGKVGILNTLRTVTAEVISQSKSKKPKGIPDEILRRKYLQLLKQLEQNGWAVGKADTAEQIKHKLSQLYPNQEPIIEVITEAYCERRYAEREPENVELVLQAFSTLERIK